MNWFNLKCHLLMVLVLIYCSSWARSDDSDEEAVPKEQNVEVSETQTAESVLANSPINLMNQFFRQPSLRPTLSYNRGQSISYNIGHNLGRTLGKTPFKGESLDPQVSDSKVVLVLAKDTPETSDLPKPDEASLKRLVRNPGFWDDFATQMATFNEQLSQHVPAISRTMGAGLNEFIAQTPILGDAHQTGAIDFANLGQTVGQNLLPPNIFPPNAEVSPAEGSEAEAPPPPEAEVAENDLSMNGVGPLLDNPLFRNLQQFVPPTLPSPLSLGTNPFPFNPMTDFPWMGQSPQVAASHLSEVRVKPDAKYSYNIAPKEALSQKMMEMKLRAALKDGLYKKSVPILWFRLPEENESDSTTYRPFKTPMSMTEEDMIMQSKLQAFQKQLIAELKQLQEVVKLANAMKKSQLEANGKKSKTTEAMLPLSLSNTSIYKITLADIEKTLKDEYVRKLLQTIYNSQRQDMLQQTAKYEGTNTKYTTDWSENPSKRQTMPTSDAMTHLSKDDMMKMMAFAYRMAAANSQAMSWMNDDRVNSVKDMSKPDQRQWLNTNPEVSQEQPRMTDDQPQMIMDTSEAEGTPEEHVKKGQQHHHHHHHSHHFPRQWIDPEMQMQQLGNADLFQMPMGTTAEQKERQWLEANGQMPQQIMQQTMPQNAEQRQWLESGTSPQQNPTGAMPEQRQWLESNKQMKTQTFQQTMPQQTEQRQWLESNAQMRKDPFQQTMSQTSEQRQWLEPNAQMKHQTMPQLPEQRQWLEPNAPMKQQTMPQTPEQRQWLESNAQMKQQTMPQTGEQRQWLESNAQVKQQTMPETPEQRQWMEPNGQMKQQTMPQIAEQRQWIDSNNQQRLQVDPVTVAQEPHPWTDPNSQMKNPLQQDPMIAETDSNAQMNMQRLEQSAANQDQMPMQMRQMPPMNTGTIMQMRQWLDSQMEKNPEQQTPTSGATAEMSPKMPMPQQRQMIPHMSRPTEQIDPNMQMREWAASNPISAEQMPSHNPQFQMMEQRQMTNEAGEKPGQMMRMDEQAQSPDTSTNMERQSGGTQAEHMMMHKMPQTDESQITANNESGMPMEGEATPQMPENAGKARHKGLEIIVDDFDLFGHHKKRPHGHGTVVNYYYNPGGSRYPPIYASPGGYAPPPSPRPSYSYGGSGYTSPAPPSYGGYAKPQPSMYAQSSGYYGSGGYGSNAYGSRGGGYRTAVGDDEIQEMLREHQTMPKMMLLIQKPDDNSQPLLQVNQLSTGFSNPSSAKTITSLDETSAPTSAGIKFGLKSLAKSPKYKKRRRSKRSADYATLEPIDESSLNQLRKTYKNTLKEITLNPNETPAEALMRYNAESVREALAKATKEPMEISAGDEDQELHQKVGGAETHQENSYGMDSGYIAMPSVPAYNQNLQSSNTGIHNLGHSATFHYGPQLKSQLAGSSQVNSMASTNYQNQYQLPQFGDVVPMYPYPSKALPHNPYAGGANTYEPPSYVNDYPVPSSSYQIANNGVPYTGSNSAINPSTPGLYSAQYVKSEAPAYNPRSSQFTAELPHYSNDISKMPVSLAANGYSSGKNQRKITQLRGKHKSTPNDSSHKSQSQVDTTRIEGSYHHEGSSNQHNEAGNDDLKLGSLYEAMKKRLSQCCNECKENLLSDLTKALRTQLGKESTKPSAGKTDYSRSSKRHHQRADQEDNDEDQFGDWLLKMMDKGYKKEFLTRDHQQDYETNDRLHLALDERDDEENMMHGENQSCKRDTTVVQTEKEMAKDAETDTDNDTNVDIDLMTTKRLKANQIEKREDEVQIETADSEAQDDVLNAESINEKLENDSSSQEAKANPSNHSLEPAESTTHSIYALRGKYKPQKHHASNALTKVYGNKIAGYKSLKLLGSAKSLHKSKFPNNDISKMFSKKDVEKYKNLEEILDLLHELSKARRETQKNTDVQVKCSTPSQSTTTTAQPLKSERKSCKNSTVPPNSTVSSSTSSLLSAEKLKRRKSKSSAKCRRSSKNGEDETEVIEAQSST